MGMGIGAAICALTPYNNVYRQATLLGGGHFPLAPFLVLFWLTIFLGLLARVFRNRHWLNGKELLTVWVLSVLVSGIAYTGLARTFFINLTAPYHYATVENRWGEVLQPLLPKALYPQNSEAIGELYNGLPGGREMSWAEVAAKIPWKAWLAPLMIWGSFILLCYGVMILIINLISRQWLHNERMNLPLLRVPQMMMEAYDSQTLRTFFSDHYLLAGILLPVCLHLLNGLSFYYPTVPQLPTLVLAGTYFGKTGLFAGFYKLKIYIYPAFIGFAFLASRQISFSFWLFFILGSLLIGLLGILGYQIPSAALGVTFGPTLSRPEETQMIGAYLVFFLFIIWLGRNNYWGLVCNALKPRQKTPSRTEWIDPSLSFWGLAAGLAGIVLWCGFFGMGYWPAFLLAAAFFVVLVVTTRVICQGGIAYFTLTAAPLDSLIVFFGPRLFSTVGILLAGVVQKLLFVDLRESLMPSLLHASKITHREGNRQMLLLGIALTVIVGVCVSFVAMLMLCYKFGIRELPLDWATRTTVAVYDNIYTLVETPVQPDNWVILFSIAGAVVMLLLVICYHRAYWWPIHPIGYLTAYSSAMRILWFSFFVGWLFNSLCMRYGGIVLFKKLRLFFIGLIIGDFLMGGAWAFVGFFTDVSYQVLPN